MIAFEDRFEPVERIFSKRSLIFVPLSVLFLSTLFLWMGGFLATGHPSPPIFRHKDEVSSFLYLAKNAPPDSIVLATFETGNALPAWAPLRVVIGHGPESVNLAELRPQVQTFYSTSISDNQRIESIREWGVQYVFWGPAERILGDWNPAQASFLKLDFEAGEYQVYRVNFLK
jgi:hypothetical protein